MVPTRRHTKYTSKSTSKGTVPYDTGARPYIRIHSHSVGCSPPKLSARTYVHYVPDGRHAARSSDEECFRLLVRVAWFEIALWMRASLPVSGKNSRKW